MNVEGESPKEISVQPHSMLVVADLNLDPALFDHLLRQEWKVEYVASNAEAFCALTRRPFDLVVTAERTSANEDLRLLQKMRTVRPHTRMIILTGESTTEDAILALRQHAFSYFSPPYTCDTLCEMIHAAMEESCWDDGIEVVSATRAWIRLLVRSDRKTAERLMQFFDEFADIPEEERGQVAYALREMLMNAIYYGGQLDADRYVEVQYLRAKHAVACRIKDPGPGFDRNDLRHAAVKNPPDDPTRHMQVREAAGLRPGGYGILLALHLVDELVYSEKGNEVLLIKYLHSGHKNKSVDTKIA